MKIWNVNICFDHTGQIEARDIDMDDYATYQSSSMPRYFFHFARYNNKIYSHVGVGDYSGDYSGESPRHFFKTEHMKIQLSEDLYSLYEDYLKLYKSNLLNNKLDKIL